jgi:UDP-glucose 4-epimerase
MKMLVTGAAGFIGSSLVDRLLAEGHEVVGVDNFITGQIRFLETALRNPKFRLVERDLFDASALEGVLSAATDWVFHLAANADVRDGLKHPGRDLDQNTIVTWNVLEAMRHAGAKNIAFSSTGSVYGETVVIPTPENCPFPIQTSLYGASKLAAEALLSAYAEGYGFRAVIFRFVSILGERYTHGHVFDFLKKLQQTPDRLAVLGDGHQKKSYLYIHDCLDAMLAAIAHRGTTIPTEIYNLGTDEYVEVNDSIDIICKELKVAPRREYSGGSRGWVGDNPFIFLDCKKIRKLGWKPKSTIRQAIQKTARYLLDNPWVLTTRSSS